MSFAATVDLAWRNRIFYAFVAPFAALTAVFGIWPIALSIQVSFTASSTALGGDPTYVGWANYARVLADPIFVASMGRTLVYTALAVAANLAFALAVATLIDSPRLKRGSMFFRLALFLPVVTPDVAGYVVWRWLFDRSFGAVNAAADLLGLPPFGGISSVDTVLAAVLIAELWHHAGLYMTIFLANLAMRDRALEEILPQLRPAIVVNLVYATIQFLKTFTVVVVMTKGGPADRTNFVSYYAYQLFDQGRYGEATAMATLLFAVVIALSMGAFRLVERSEPK
jgi:ABC-type sugar transport system permease subunit